MAALLRAAAGSGAVLCDRRGCAQHPGGPLYSAGSCAAAMSAGRPRASGLLRRWDASGGDAGGVRRARAGAATADRTETKQFVSAVRAAGCRRRRRKRRRSDVFVSITPIQPHKADSGAAIDG